MHSLMLKATIRNGRIELDEPMTLPEGLPVFVSTTASNNDDGPMTPEEIARTLAAMKKLEPLEIPDDVMADLDAWERKINQHGIDRDNADAEDFFR